MSMRPVHLVGLFLWRGGSLLVAAAVVFEIGRYVLRWFTPPLQIEIGAGLIIAGAALVIMSLVIERVHDARAEREWMK